MKDFKKGFVKAKTKSEYNIGKVLYNEERDEFTVLFGKDKVLKVNAYDFENAKYIYAKPANDKQEDWHKRLFKGINAIRTLVVSKYWSCVKPNQKVKGIIKGDEFVIKRY